MITIVWLDDPIERLNIIRSLIKWDEPISDGMKTAIMALSSTKLETVAVIGIFDDGVFKGAMSYRYQDDSIKRINTGVVEKSKGYGSALVNALKMKYPDTPQWCHSIAPGWCEKLGMELVAVLPDGRHHYTLK